MPATALPCCLFLSFVTERLQNEKKGVGANLCCLVLHYPSCRENILSCKAHSSVSSEEEFYCTKILTYFGINGLVLVEKKMVSVTFAVSLHIFILLPALQLSVRSKQNKASFKSNLFIYRWSLTLSMA